MQNDWLHNDDWMDHLMIRDAATGEVRPFKLTETQRRFYERVQELREEALRKGVPLTVYLRTLRSRWWYA